MRRRLPVLAMTAAVLLGSCSGPDAEKRDQTEPSTVRVPSAPDEPTRAPGPQGTEETPARDSPTAAPTHAPTGTAAGEVWTDAPNDGTWDGGDVPFGVVREASGALEGYTFAVRDLPTFTTADGGDTVTVTTVLELEHVEGRGREEPLDDHVDVSFRPGNYSPARHDEEYMTGTRVECSPEDSEVGLEATCTLSFTAEAAEVPNFYWVINGRSTAAWPSQS